MNDQTNERTKNKKQKMNKQINDNHEIGIVNIF